MSTPRALIALAALTLVACTTAPSSAGPAQSTASAAPTVAASRSPDPTVRPTPTAPLALVGNWLGMHNCQRIVDIMTAADMPEQALLNAAESGTVPGVSTIEDIADPEKPCVGATDMPHWHFFNADGEFGSLDMNRQQVDDGRWRIVDADTLEINGTRFEFHVDRDELRIEPEAVGVCPVDGQWCPEAWKLMVAMPGMAWARDG
jgi:hypothetical protein